MRATELIDRLQAAVEEHGDLLVVTHNDEEFLVKSVRLVHCVKKSEDDYGDYEQMYESTPGAIPMLRV